MNYKKFFSDELISLKSQGLYRKFRAINRNQSSFPKATERFEGKEREVEVWCSNDYLNLSQHPEVTKVSIDVINELGTGSGGTRNISGTSTYHVDLESLLADCTRKKQVYYFLQLTQPISRLFGHCAKTWKVSRFTLTSLITLL